MQKVQKVQQALGSGGGGGGGGSCKEGVALGGAAGSSQWLFVPTKFLQPDGNRFVRGTFAYEPEIYLTPG